MLLALATLLIATNAHARGGQGGASQALDAVRAVAPQADFIVILDDGAGQRQSPSGRAMTGLLVDLGLAQQDGELARAWSELASAFGLDNARAFDELFGRRMILISEGTTLQGLNAWALGTVIPTPTALDVVKKLGAKGRGIEAGQTLFAIEGGAYRVTLLRPRGSGAQDTHRLVVFSPRNSGDLLRTLVRGLVEPRHWEPVVGAGKRPAPSIAASFQFDGAEVARLGVVQADTGWRGQAHFEMPEFEQRSSGWSGEEFAKLADGAWLAMADEVDLALLADSPLSAALPLGANRLRELAGHCTGRVFLRVVPDEPAGVALSVCLEMDASPEAAALADRAVRDIAGLLTGSPDAVPDYRGFMPEALRTAPIRGEFSDQVLRPMIGTDPALAWRQGAAENTSWWTTRLAPGASDHTRALDALIAGLPSGETGGRLVSLGVARPGPLASVIERGAGAANALSPTLERIDAVRWTTRQRGTRLEVTFDLGMNAEGASPEPSARQQSPE